jgi:rubrerythrin
MKEQTEKNLKDAFAGESQAHLKYMVFADLAERDGLANVARLFRAASFSEQMHAENHLRALGGIGKTQQNLEAALGGETFEITEMYPGYMEVAREEDETRALRSMNHANEAEKVHARLYAQAKESAAAGEDMALPRVWVCGVCGYTMEGEAPERCPICGAVHSKFREF